MRHEHAFLTPPVQHTEHVNFDTSSPNREGFHESLAFKSLRYSFVIAHDEEAVYQRASEHVNGEPNYIIVAKNGEVLQEGNKYDPDRGTVH